MGELGRPDFASTEVILFKELLRRSPEPGEWLLRRPNLFQNGRCFGVLSESVVEGGFVGETEFFRAFRVCFFLTRFIAEGTRFLPPVLMDVLDNSVEFSFTLLPPPKISSTT